MHSHSTLSQYTFTLQNICLLLPTAGQPVWQQSYDSPVVAIYSPQGGELRKLPMTTVALSTLNLLTGSSVLAIRADTLGIKATDTVLQ